MHLLADLKCELEMTGGTSTGAYRNTICRLVSSTAYLKYFLYLLAIDSLPFC